MHFHVVLTLDEDTKIIPKQHVSQGIQILPKLLPFTLSEKLHHFDNLGTCGMQFKQNKQINQAKKK